MLGLADTLRLDGDPVSGLHVYHAPSIDHPDAIAAHPRWREPRGHSSAGAQLFGAVPTMTGPSAGAGPPRRHHTEDGSCEGRFRVGMSVGLLRMSEHPGERRDFMPRFVHRLEALGASEIVLEVGYGSGMGLDAGQYLVEGGGVRFGDREDCLAQDVVLVIRCPQDDVIKHLRPGAILVSMLHYATRPARNSLLSDLGVRAVSLDSITDDRGRRLVENLELTAWAGVAEAFRQLALGWGAFAVPGRPPIRVTLLGAGALGMHAVHAASRYGDHEVREALHHAGVPGVEVAVVDHDLSWHEDYMVLRLRETDLLMDATLRRDPTVPVVPNGWVALLPAHATMLDLAADPYDLTSRPPQIKGIEGIPHGSLERFVFTPDDAAWDELGSGVDTTYRRKALSCNAWPGLRPRDSMERYGEQIEDVMEVVLGVPIETWDRASSHLRERAVARGELERWLATRRE
jgi:alanine dehydrogenase